MPKIWPPMPMAMSRMPNTSVIHTMANLCTLKGVDAGRGNLGVRE